MRTLWILFGIMAAVTVAFFIAYPSKLNEVKEQARAAGEAVLPEELRPEILPQTTRVYRWRDTSGAWVVSDQPPPEGVEHEIREYDSHINVIPALAPPEESD